MIATFFSYQTSLPPQEEVTIFSNFKLSIDKLFQTRREIVVLTDMMLKPESLHIPEASLIKGEIINEELLLGRTRMYLKLLLEHDWTQPVALLDYDVLIINDFYEVFEFQEDILVTLRPYSKQMPVNGGVVLINNKSPEKVIAFYRDVVSCFERYREKFDGWAWWGDQLALHEALVKDGTQTSNVTGVTRSGATVRFIPREIYNFTPYDVDSADSIPSILDDRVFEKCRSACIVHFKGPRKHLMGDLLRRLGLVS